MIVPYKGTKAGSRRQYNAMRPRKRGIIFFIRAGVSGLVYLFSVGTADKTLLDLLILQKKNLQWD